MLWRLRTGWKEESNGWRSGRSAIMFLGLMYITDPFAMMLVVSRMSHMKGVVVKTIHPWQAFFETRTQQKVVHAKDIDSLAAETLGA